MGDLTPQPKKPSGGTGCLIVKGLLILIPIIVVVGLVSFYAAFARQAKLELAKQIAEIRAAGDPVTPAEVAPPPIPDEENAAPILQDAFKLLADDPKSALEKVREALKRPKCRFELDYSQGMTMEVPHLARMRDIARLLDMSAQREFDAGRPDEALREALDAVRLARLLEDEPLLISQLVRIAMVGIAVNRIAPIVASRRPSAETLDETARALETCAAGREPFIRAVKGERALASATVDLNFKRARHLRGIVAKNKVVYYNYMARYLSAQEKPYWLAAPELAAMDTELRAPTEGGYLDKAALLVTGLMVPGLTRIPKHLARSEAWTAVVRLGCLVELYRQKRGTLPAKLKDLVPEFARELPVDPFSGKGYIYRLKPDGQSYVIYSVGENGKDDAGVWDATGGKLQNWENGDIVFECPAVAPATEEPDEGR